MHAQKKHLCKGYQIYTILHNDGCRGQGAKSFTGESRPRATRDARNAASISKQQSQQALAGFSQASPWVNLWEQTNQAKDEHQHAKHHPCHGTESYEYIWIMSSAGPINIITHLPNCWKNLWMEAGRVSFDETKEGGCHFKQVTWQTCFFWDNPTTACRSQHTCQAKCQSIRCKNAMAYAESQLHLGHFWTRLRSASSRCQGHYGPKSQDLPSSTDCNRMHSPNHQPYPQHHRCNMVQRCNSWSKLRGQSWTGSSWSGPKPQALCGKHCVTKVTPKQNQIQTTSNHHVVTSDLRNVNLWYLCSRIQTNIKLRRSQTHDRIDSPIWPSSFNFSIFSESLNWPQSKSAKTLTLEQPMAHTSLSKMLDMGHPWAPWAIHGYPVIKTAIK